MSADREVPIHAQARQPSGTTPYEQQSLALARDANRIASHQTNVGLLETIILAASVGAAAWAAWAAARAARTAKASIDTIIEIERPHLMFGEMKPGDMYQPSKTPACVVRLENHGRGPAFLRKIGFEVLVGSELPAGPPRPTMNEMIRPVPPGGAFEYIEFLNKPNDYMATISDATLEVFLVARIEYVDNFGRQHESNGAFKLVAFQFNSPDRFWPVGSQAYWRHS